MPASPPSGSAADRRRPSARRGGATLRRSTASAAGSPRAASAFRRPVAIAPRPKGGSCALPPGTCRSTGADPSTHSSAGERMGLLDNLLGTGEPTVKVGEVAPEFDLPDRSGKRVRLSDFQGKRSSHPPRAPSRGAGAPGPPSHGLFDRSGAGGNRTARARTAKEETVAHPVRSGCGTYRLLPSFPSLRNDGRRGRRAQEEIGADTPFVAMPVT